MAPSVFDKWCELEDRDLGERRSLHVLRERDDVRSSVESQIDETVISHYEDPRVLSERIARVGLGRAAAILTDMLPRSKTARSGHLGEIFATEAAPSILKTFHIPIKRLRWLDGREAALRGEDLIGIETTSRAVRFPEGRVEKQKQIDASRRWRSA